MARTEALWAPALLLRGLLTGAGAGLPVPALAALADLPTATTCRHLDHLVRTGVAQCSDARYAILRAPAPTETGADGEVRPGAARGHIAPERDGAPGFVAGEKEGAAISPDPAGWSRAAHWYLASLHRAAVVLRSASLPGRESISAGPDRPAAPLERPAEALAWYQGAVPEIELVLERAIAGGDDEQAWRLALLSANIAALTRPIGSWELVLGTGLDAARRVKDPEAESMILEYTGHLLLQSGHVDNARTVQGAALHLRVKQRDPVGQVRSHYAQGQVELRDENLAAAETHFSMALDLAAGIPDAQFAALARLNLGASRARRGARVQAHGLLEQAAAYFRETGQAGYLAGALHEQAAIYRRHGEHSRALQLATDAVEEAVRAQLPIHLAGAVGELGRVHAAMGALDAAGAAFAEAKAIYAEADDVLRADRVEQEISNLRG